MKNGWQRKPMADVCEVFADGDWVESKDQSPEGIRLIQTSNVGEGVFKDRAEKARYISVATFKRLRCTEIFEGDCLISRLPDPAGRSCILPDTGERMITAVDCTIIRFNPKSVIPKFFNYYTQSRNYLQDVDSETTGTTRKRISRSKLGDVYIPVPLLPEQQRIVGLLDEAFEGIAVAKANAEKNLQNARALFQSVLYQSVIGEITKSWREAEHARKTTADSDLKELFRQIVATDRKLVRSEETTGHEIINDALPKEWRHPSIGQLFNLIDYRGKTASKSDTGHRLITARNIRMGFLSEEPVTFISEEQYKKWMVRGFPKPGDIFFVTEGHTMGFVALNTRTDEFALAQRTITLQPPVPFSTKFFFYFMLSPHFQKLIKLNATGAAAVGMKASKFRSLPLAFPSFAEQEVIANKLDELSEETQHFEGIYQQKLAALEELKKSLLHQAFNGEL
jgi:type I restriction enzyme S subunit